VVTQTVSACICDDRIIGENGAGDCLHKTPKEILVID